MNYYIGTEAQCEAYDALVISKRNYDGVLTTRWCTPRQHPTNLSLWCIPQKPGYEDEDETLQLVEALNESWFPQEP